MISRIAVFGCTLMLGGALIVGCEKQEEKKPVTPPGSVPTPSVEKDSDKAMSNAASAVNEAKNNVEASADQAAKDMSAAANDAQEKASDAAESAQDTAADANSEITAKASELIDQAKEYIKENKWDMAESAVKQLEAMKGSLPAEYQGQVENVRKMFDTAKATSGGAGGIKLPGQ